MTSSRCWSSSSLPSSSSFSLSSSLFFLTSKRVGGEARLASCWGFPAVVRSAPRRTRKANSGAMGGFSLRRYR